MDATIKVVYDNPSEEKDLSDYENKESFDKMMERKGWPGCISLKDLKRQHPAGIYVREVQHFYYFSAAAILGYHELASQDPDGGDEMMFYEEEFGSVEIELLGEDEVEELKEIAFQIKRNFDEVFKNFYINELYTYDYHSEWSQQRRAAHAAHTSTDT